MLRCIFDWKRTLYDPDARTLIDGTTEILSYLHATACATMLCGKGADMMREEVGHLGIALLFDEIRFTEGDKDETCFAGWVDRDKPEDTVFIGDRACSELAIGKTLGAVTIWVRQGKFSGEEPEGYRPTYTVESLAGALDIIKKLAPR